LTAAGPKEGQEGRAWQPHNSLPDTTPHEEYFDFDFWLPEKRKRKRERESEKGERESGFVRLDWIDRRLTPAVPTFILSYNY
jgi:hypothetical protein